MKITQEILEKGIQVLKANDNFLYENPCLIFNRVEWLNHPFMKFTEEELDKADERGFIATKNCVDCYLTRSVPALRSSLPL